MNAHKLRGRSQFFLNFIQFRARFNEESLKLKLNIADTFLPENDGSARALDVKWFSFLIMGVVDFGKLWECGLANVSDEGYVDQLNRLFWVQRKPVTNEEF